MSLLVGVIKTSERVQKIPKGYKKTDIGIIPEDWEVKKLGEIAEIVGRIGFRGYTKKDIVKPWKGAISLSPINIVDGKLVLYKNLTFISWFKYEESPEIKVKKGDILFVKTGSTLGKSALVRELYYPATINPQLVTIKIKKFDSVFLSYCLNSNIFKHYLAFILGGGAIPTLSQYQLANLLIPLPPTLSEQRIIARVLSDIDRLIESLDKLIEKKKLIKKGTMQQLLTGKKRLPGFTGEWVRKKLGEIFFITRGLVLATKYMKKERIGKYRFPVYSSQTQNNGVIGFYDKFLYEDAITWTTDGANAGDVKFRKGKFYCTNVCGVLLNEEGYSNQCIAEIFGMVSKKYVSYVGNPKLMNNVVKNIEITFPPTLSEQRAIAQILSDMDAEIEALERKKQKYEMMKKAAMELLLTGKVRLKFNNKK